MSLTWDERRQITSDKVYLHGTCLNTDTKPEDDYISNGSELMEMDTATLYLYDAENKTWRAWK